MKKVLVFGNSGSGKTTLSKQLAEKHGLSHLDLDSIAWQATTPPQREHHAKSKALIDSFCHAHDRWVIEGCYSDLLSLVSDRANEVIFLNLPVELCVENARNRPWEKHKYPSKEVQDQNLNMLIDWISAYEARSDTFSKRAHQSLYDSFEGVKTLISTNREQT